MLHHFKDSRVKMLIAVFPDIGLQEHKFNKMPSMLGRRKGRKKGKKGEGECDTMLMFFIFFLR